MMVNVYKSFWFNSPFNILTNSVIITTVKRYQNINLKVRWKLLQYFLVPFVLNGGSGFPNGRTNFIAIYFFNQSFRFFNMGYGATLAWLIFIVSLILTIALFGSTRYWVYYAGEE